LLPARRGPRNKWIRTTRDIESVMSMIFSDVTAVQSRLGLSWNNTGRYSSGGSVTARMRDLTAVVVLCAVGLTGTLLFVHFVPDGLSAIIVQVP
jgi:hypothetical protein